jgi:hypothetical protein
MSINEAVNGMEIEDARVIQMEDFEETAAWCGGEPGIMYEGLGEGQHYIQLDDFNRGFVGSWICKTGELQFIILKDEEYKRTFYAASKHRETFAAVLAVVKATISDSMNDISSRDGVNLNMITEAAALRIMELTEHTH